MNTEYKLIVDRMSAKNYKTSLPKTPKGYLLMLLRIANDSSCYLKNATDKEIEFIADVRADIQNSLGEDLHGVMKKHNIEFEG